ncbi:accessory gene regulator B family protein [Sedimentibacter hydroxybenzoicus DSM 7310]|uniref:Accessory gene regulator B family protein n=1 Tax=Sedimentibacter hydroxybenzoicus DSM 7310 TaxID=1123245 RepID=A0A974BJ00_SEDHY|nr:accessory gene regulator B family protein [Sedimentibacter hydroxybenzoicus]NYB74130.1 accessory gene regulator B family protein [Sedimentibacter hydroxybenzoicus DSM 7310]
MESYFENKIVDYIKKNKDMNTYDEEVLRYGIQIYYFNISKLLILLAVSIILDIFAETSIVFLLIAVLKRFSYGFHADTFFSCILITFINIFGIVYLSKFSLNPLSKTIIAIISIILFTLYAPADTEERPLVNKKKRLKLKVQSIFTSVLYFVLSFFTDEQLSNMLILSLIFIGFNTSPVLYILFKKEYKNYEKFI